MIDTRRVTEESVRYRVLGVGIRRIKDKSYATDRGWGRVRPDAEVPGRQLCHVDRGPFSNRIERGDRLIAVGIDQGEADYGITDRSRRW